MNTQTLNYDTGEIDYALAGKLMWNKGEPMDEQTEGGDQAIVFPATLHRKVEDHEGEVTLTLKVPKSAMLEMAQLSALYETALNIRVTVGARQGKMEFGN